MQIVIQTPTFLADAKSAGLSEDEQKQIVDFLAAHPTAGDVIKGTSGARKIRFAGRGKGKSGGYRVVTFYGGEDIPIFLLNLYSKGDRVDLSQAERNELGKILRDIADTYRQGTKRYVSGWRTNS